MSFAHVNNLPRSRAQSEALSLSDGSESPPPSSTPNHAFMSSQTTVINATLEKDFTVNFNCGHLGMNIVGNGDVTEARVGCLSECCVDILSDKVIEGLFTPAWRKEFQALVALAVSNEVNDIYKDDTFATFFHSCAAEEVARALEAAKVRQTYQAAQRRTGSSFRRAHRGLSVPLEETPLGDVSSAGPLEGIELTRLGTMNPARRPMGVIPGDGIINRNVNPTMRRLISRLPKREVVLPNRASVTYFTPPSKSTAPFYWVPYGHAIGVFSG
ncbi:hypothetical protein CONPUDRAFT_159088 [Coniophora puteana RWD-64-598 SS2]|uniref:Uncharacterized protein n=1 Tax=Coniophora puteana (strain RWD-64-598) TaxID=741705 RepID=A0A5M3MAJ5_CONPW|nr:uncharacterized protein CONPUDRAFT_159088 [Coniophora puteana RWD-64-598 SS2]EIW75645.1 hypothetical protein CONPUDRAFT_159088 [Coniophora puteana RWD-64-598 SS2]